MGLEFGQTLQGAEFFRAIAEVLLDLLRAAFEMSAAIVMDTDDLAQFQTTFGLYNHMSIEPGNMRLMMVKPAQLP